MREEHKFSILNFVVAFIILLAIVSCGSLEQQGDEASRKFIESKYKKGEYFQTLETVKPKLKPFDLDSFVNSYPPSENENFTEVESNFIEGARVFLENQRGVCRLRFMSNYDIFKNKYEFNIKADIDFKSHEIVNKEGKKLDVSLKNSGGSTGKNRDTNTKTFSKFYKSSTDCNDKSEYSGEAVFDYKILMGVDTAVVTIEKVGDTVRIGDYSLVIEEFGNNYIVFEMLSQIPQYELSFQNFTSDFKKIISNDPKRIKYTQTTMYKEIYEIFKNNKDISFSKFEKKYNKAKPFEKDRRYLVIRTSNKFETCLLFIRNYTDAKEMKVDYVVEE